MIDQAQFPRDKTCGDGLTPMAVKSLDLMGVLPQVEAAGATRIDHVRIVGPFGMSATMAFADYLSEDKRYALVLPRLHFDEIMRAHAVGTGVEYLESLRVKQIFNRSDRIVKVSAIGPKGAVEIRAQHVVIAVGASMGMLKREGFLKHRPHLIRAARGYYANTRRTPSRYNFYFDAQLLPGYGWIFPAGDGIVNIGIGVLPVFWSSKRPAQKLLAEFVERRIKEGVLEGGKLVGPVKGYPLRIGFPAQRVAGGNWVIVGEATGLVNPVTGEGIDLAIQSGLLAAEVIDADVHMGRSDHLAYQRELWDRFGSMFTGLRFLRNILLTPFFTDYALWLMRQHRFLAQKVMGITQGFTPPQNVLHPLFILQFFTPLTLQLVLQELRKALSKTTRG